MKIMVIHTSKQTTLTIVTAQGEPLGLDQMRGDGTPHALRALRPGATTTVLVDAGLYRIMSGAVRVTAEPTALWQDTVNVKDDPPEHLTNAFDDAALRRFLETKGESLSAPPPS